MISPASRPGGQGRLRRFSIAAVMLLAFVLAGSAGKIRAAEVIPPPPAAYFNDYAGLVRPATASALNAELEQFERATSNQIVVATYPRMQSDSSIEDYTVRVAQSWQVGDRKRKNGAVLFVFAQEHTAYLQVGYGLEAVLPDALAERIIADEMVPHFRRGDYDGGLTAGVDAILAATRGEYHGAGRTAGDRKDSGGGPSGIVILVIFLVLIIGSFFRRHTVYRSSGRTGGGPWIFPGGGGGGGGGGWGGGGGGGFSGGGGSFGGGGAGGSW